MHELAVCQTLMEQIESMPVNVSCKKILVSGPVVDHGIAVMLAREESCEGRVVAVVDPDEAEQLLQRWHALPEGEHAAIIGSVNRSGTHVLFHTELGGERILEELEDDPLPRIC